MLVLQNLILHLMEENRVSLLILHVHQYLVHNFEIFTNFLLGFLGVENLLSLSLDVVLDLALSLDSV